MVTDEKWLVEKFREGASIAWLTGHVFNCAKSRREPITRSRARHIVETAIYEWQMGAGNEGSTG